MNEKRFKKMDTIIDPFPIWDTVEEKGYNCTDTLDVLIDLLNVMNDTLLKQAEQNHKLSNKNIEQQTTIEAKERRIMILENLLTQMGVQWVDDDE